MKTTKMKSVVLVFGIIVIIILSYHSELKLKYVENNLIKGSKSNKNIEMINKTSNLNTFNNIDIDVNISNIQIIPSDTFKIDVKYREDENEIKYEVINKTLVVKQAKDENDLKLDTTIPKKEFRGYVKIYINKNIHIDNMNLDTYISEININEIKINKLNIDCQIGQIDLDNIHISNKLEIENEMGNINIKESEIYQANLIVGSGDLNTESCNINSIDIYNDVGNIKLNNSKIKEKLIIASKLGNIDICGFLFGSTKISSENGDVKIKILEAEKNYNYSIECNLGKFNLNGKKYNKRLIVDNGKEYNIDITCNIGNVDLVFKSMN